ncbi:MAG: 16S rRNA (cytosine(967)-C(5))-methyltransferase RsmB [Burkholderiaceae bacterium]
MKTPAIPLPDETSTPGAQPSLPLATLLQHCAGAVRAVRGGVSLNVALERCPGPARAGTQALSFHALRWLGCAQAVRACLAPRAPSPEVDALLLSALSLLWPSESLLYAPHTVVDQAVAGAHQQVPRSAAFVNAVLRRFLRERDALCAAALRDPVARFNHPAWWIDRLTADWPQHAQPMLQAAQQHPPMDLRVNIRRTTALDYVARLAEQGLSAVASGGPCVSLREPCPVVRLPGFAQGDVSVQDAAAQLAAPLLVGSGLPAGARVLDACAAPGGKTAHLLELADLEVTALDRDAARLPRITQSLERLGLRSRILCADATDTRSWWDGTPFDAILLDAPCSASGIVRRHPDIRWLRRAADIDVLVSTQARLLDALWPVLKPGGRLLYATCSVFRGEGQTQIDAFLQRWQDASIARDPASPGHLLPLPDNDSRNDRPAHVSDTALAQASPGDGFYYALIEKL